jgi:23S rRNA (guanosine2251-2'-O)-methyltransferase
MGVLSTIFSKFLTEKKVIFHMENYKDKFIFGKHPVIDAIKAGQSVDKVWVQIGSESEFFVEIKGICKNFDVPMQMVPKEKLNKITGGNHQGVIAFASMIPYYKLEDVLPLIYEKEEMPLILVLDAITDVRNFGAICRSAEIFGANAIVIGKKNTARINAEAMKTSAGALSKIPICREQNVMAAVEYLQLSGVSVVSSDLKAAKSISEISFKDPVAIIIGSEGRGVHYTLSEKADDTFIIPQKGTTDSLNVSVATGIILYEASRQRT